MATVDEYVRLAQEAQQDGAHVAVFIYYRTAIERIGYDTRTGDNTGALNLLLASVKYAQNLKKEKDRKAVAQWSQEIVKRMSRSELVEIIKQEIAKLGVGKNAAA
ncbi:hypothetical protein HY637_00590 [Candidatus Woesearchaeota archaeon]|nr:hypothetical protein [Candidatus Woesearchaeota archaeon]